MSEPHVSSMPGAVPLWRQLQAAAGLLQAVRGGRSLSTEMGLVEPHLRPGVQALTFHVLRNLGRAQALRTLLAPRAPPLAVDALLCTALALAWREEGAPYSPFTLVDQAVEAAKRGSSAMRNGANFVNACLRRFLRERDALVAATDADPVAQWNHPRWWIERVHQEWPAQWQGILQANNTQAPMTLRVNRRKSARDGYLAQLAQAGIAATAVGEFGVTLQAAHPVHMIPGFTEGVVSVQDAAAQLAAPLLLAGLAPRADGKPWKVLDACAAPGGKTAHLLEYADCDVIALDVDPARCKRIDDNLQRVGLQARTIAADAAKPQSWWQQECGGALFDAILLDAPCTASGIVRRHPDVRWLRRESDVAQLAAVQARLLDALWQLLAPGGRFLYCTCSVFKPEGHAQLQTFVAHNTGAVLQQSPGHLMPQSGANGNAVPDNLQGDHDGFFYALLEKTRAP